MITGDKRSDGPEKRKRYDKYDNDKSREVMACLTFYPVCNSNIKSSMK